jgi:hypothetical protein
MGTFTSVLVGGLIIGAGIAGYMNAPWIAVPALALIALVATTMQSYATKPIGPRQGKLSVVARLAFGFVIACLLFAAAFLGGRLIAMLG